ncbi:hypothetical protein FXO37_24565 [Capsicum annuum]|nr:hypothetical protein FXO37_24565 [Capsicum annuum]
MWNIAAVIPVDKRIGSGSGGGGSNDSSSDDDDRITKVIIVSESKIETDQEQENEVRTKEERCAETPTPPLTLDVLKTWQLHFAETGENLYDLVLADIRFLTQKRKINNLPVGYRVMQQPPVPAAGQPHLDPMGMSSCHVVNGVPAQETIIL